MKTAQTVAAPATMRLIPLLMPPQFTGTLLCVLELLPNIPPLSPQHMGTPVLSKTQLTLLPTERATAGLGRPITFTGTLLLVVVPSPNWPN